MDWSNTFDQKCQNNTLHIQNINSQRICVGFFFIQYLVSKIQTLTVVSSFSESVCCPHVRKLALALAGL